MKKKAQIKFALSGLLIGIIATVAIMGALGLLLTEFSNKYPGVNDTQPFGDYTVLSSEIINSTKSIQGNSTLKSEEESSGIITGLRSGISVFYSTLSGVALGENLLNTIGDQIPAFGYFVKYIWAIILILIFVGLFITALLKVTV